MENSIYVTVFTPTYNRANSIDRVFSSLKKQSYKNFEWIVIDDGSTDNTKQVVEQYIKDGELDIRYIFMRIMENIMRLMKLLKWQRETYF